VNNDTIPFFILLSLFVTPSLAYIQKLKRIEEVVDAFYKEKQNFITGLGVAICCKVLLLSSIHSKLS
jgi:hypothetical protein